MLKSLLRNGLSQSVLCIPQMQRVLHPQNGGLVGWLLILRQCNSMEEGKREIGNEAEEWRGRVPGRALRSWSRLLSRATYYFTSQGHFLRGYMNNCSLEKSLSDEPRFPLVRDLPHRVLTLHRVLTPHTPPGCTHLIVFFFFFLFWSIITSQCYISFCWYNEVNQLYVYIYPLPPPRPHPTHQSAPCIAQQPPTSCLFYTW